MSPQVFTHRHRVTYAECTVGNHVYYARYLDFLEEARGEFFRSLEIPLLELDAQGVKFPVIEVQLRYRGMARYDDVVRIEVWLSELRGVKMAFSYRVVNAEEKVLLEGSTIHACVNLEDKPIRIPEDVAAKLDTFLARKA
jgi:acyl-CoA thioester hydrolase